ncbi:DUF1826 domain-containing protein [Litoreibacter albidus]|uniref:DUF1826 domain-containing protein n=1 Tax=Litoreibacter albidus TaxID=670155 RepID=A0A1H2YV12_9RHOB|nr:DUF1826 domain-containing protein [Litoreibacter albidus]SDX08895.1 Protein of unknown function [Litoreibacter albidus]
MIGVQEKARDLSTGVHIGQSAETLHRISDAACAAAIWDRPPLPTFQSWIDALPPAQLPSARVILPAQAVKDAVTTICDAAETPDCMERTRLIDDIAALADIFAGVMATPYLRLRLACITTNSCRKFHLDAVTARLICTYRGTGTQYGVARDGADPTRIVNTPTCAPIVLRGSRWPTHPASGLVHRSPPIEGTGEARLVLVLDPIDDPEDAP